MEDPRLQQIQDDIETEIAATNSLSAFTGFGRSTDRATKVEKVNELGQKRIKVLETVIQLENQLKNGWNEGLAKALGAAQQNLADLAQQAQKRRAQISQELTGAGQNQGQKLRSKSLLGTRSFGRTKKFKLNKIKKPSTKGFKVQTFRTKKLNTVTAPKNNIVSRPSFGSIIASNRSKSFGGKTTLSGKRA